LKGWPFAGAEEVVDAAVEDVALALPSGAEAAGQVVHLEDLAVVAVHLGVAAVASPAMPAPIIATFLGIIVPFQV
jgi:hypothetical protein